MKSNFLSEVSGLMCMDLTLEEPSLPSHPKELLSRGRFTVTLVHLEIQGPSLALDIHKAQGEILVMSSCCDILKNKMYESEAF